MNLSQDQRKKIKDILNKHNIKKAGIFGSYARGEAVNGKSDLDLIVELSQNDLFELTAVKLDIEEALGLSVDIITYSGLKKFAKKEDFKKEIIKDQVSLI
ncbi:nucleotidyltransferase family protein [Halanaerobium sp.]|uniref:nucleotidyltransferase family protein n=1 Tax=Halanaerobium sp. TaxID=1895664 RepID=UPI000DE701A5|nr:nucleotidyltransferase domain-containing protein [Halanaerobium sp.]PUU88117.1 MAG: DNA polymerase beta domain-containing protein region [Halanaerobium sp.]PUU91448.1 MAG: DNA polymerase beta domain-containing protein region [Halanaerobium sp.]